MESTRRENAAGLGSQEKASEDYVIRTDQSPFDLSVEAWDALLHLESDPSPFMRLEYLRAMHSSGSATQPTGWRPRFVSLWKGDELCAACPLYLKDHSYGEYVFDWAWASAYERHGLRYYPKALVAVPFTPVPGARLLARSSQARTALAGALLEWTRAQKLSSVHVLFAHTPDLVACEAAGFMLRHTVQFHWHNHGYTDFSQFLSGLQQDKRKKIRQERRKVGDAGVRFRRVRGSEITPADWDFFYSCYAQTYREHGNPPYLNADFFSQVAKDMSEHWLMCVAERDGRPMGCSLIGLDPAHGIAYGRYWGALERVDCLHFEACYYQPIEWCIANGFGRFEGGAQGEHKMARALLPVRTSSAHWLAHPDFSDAVDRFLHQEGEAIDDYLIRLADRSPLRKAGDEEGKVGV